MDKATQRDIAKRLLAHHHNKTTEYAPEWVEYPADRYYSEEQHRLEIEYVFGRYPLIVALTPDLPEPWSWHTVDFTPTPILLVRREDGEVRAFANVCGHRGMQVASGCGTGARRFACPYHNWTYDTDGALVGMPMADGFDGLCRDDYGLVPLPVVERHGLILACCRPGEEIDADAYFSGLGPELDFWDFAGNRPVGDPDVHHMQGNWKVCWDTFNETYHVPYLHPDTLAKMTLGNCLAVDNFGSHCRMATPSRTFVELEEQPEEEWDTMKYVSFQYRMLPNTAFSISHDGFAFYQMYPGSSPGESVIVRRVYVRKELTEEQAEATRQRWQWIWQGVNVPEDFSVVELQSRALASRVKPTTVFGANEPVAIHLHQELERVIAEGIARDGVSAPDRRKLPTLV